jgi:RNA polymerase sigma-70 factor (ECF subfamily)
MDEVSDDEIRAETDRIVTGLMASDPDAVEEVAGWARVVAGHHAWGFETPEDIVQDTLLALIRNVRERRFSGGNLRAYVRRVAKNQCISSYRKARTRGVQVPLNGDAPGVSKTVSPGGEDMERSAMAHRILESLDETCRHLITLAYFQGLSRREIAERLGISETAAKVRLFRCIERARAMQAGERGPSASRG